MTAVEKLARQRLSLLELAEALGNASEACRRRGVSRTGFYDSVAALQEDFNAWLEHCNTERPHLGYRNLGRRPIETINEYLESVREAA